MYLCLIFNITYIYEQIYIQKLHYIILINISIILIYITYDQVCGLF